MANVVYNTIKGMTDAGTFVSSGILVDIGGTIVTIPSGLFLGNTGGGNTASGINYIGFSVPTEFSVSPGAIVGSGTFTISKVNESAYTVYAGPTTGSAQPTFTVLSSGYIPNLSYQQILGLGTAANQNSTAFDVSGAAGSVGSNLIALSGTLGTAAYKNTTQAVFNASGLQGVNVSTNTPTTNQVLQYNGTNWIPSTINIASSGGSLVYQDASVPTGNTISNTSALTNFASSYNFASGVLTSGSVVRVKLFGGYSTQTLTAPQLNVGLKLGANIIGQTSNISTLLASTSNLGWNAELIFDISSSGVNGTVESQGYSIFETVAGATSIIPVIQNTSGVPVNTNLSLDLTPFAQWNTASASNSIQLRMMTIELLSQMNLSSDNDSFSITDGINTVDNVSRITVSGAIVGGVSPNATLTVINSGISSNLESQYSVNLGVGQVANITVNNFNSNKFIATVLKPAALEGSPVSWWKFDEGTGTSTADSTGLNNGTFVGSPTWITGKIGTNALTFDGSSSYVQASDTGLAIGASERSISLWTKWTTLTTTIETSSIFGYGGSYPHDIYISANSNGTIGAYIQDSISLNSNITINDGNWHQITFTINKDLFCILYVDGVVQASGYSYTINTTSGGTVYIGALEASAGGDSRWRFSGSVDDVRFYNRTLSAVEVYYLATNTSYPIIPSGFNVASIGNRQDVSLWPISTSGILLGNNTAVSGNFILNII